MAVFIFQEGVLQFKYIYRILLDCIMLLATLISYSQSVGPREDLLVRNRIESSWCQPLPTPCWVAEVILFNLALRVFSATSFKMAVSLSRVDPGHEVARLSTALYFFVFFRSMSARWERRENWTAAQNGRSKGSLPFAFALKNREAVDSLRGCVLLCSWQGHSYSWAAKQFE